MDGWLVTAPQRAKQWGAQAVLPDSVLDEKRKWARSPGGSRLGKMSQSDVIHVIGVSISTQPMAADGLISKAACETGGCWSGRGPRRQARDSARSARDARRIAGGRRPWRSSRPALAPDSQGRCAGALVHPDLPDQALWRSQERGLVRLDVPGACDSIRSGHRRHETSFLTQSSRGNFPDRRNPAGRPGEHGEGARHRGRLRETRVQPSAPGSARSPPHC